MIYLIYNYFHLILFLITNIKLLYFKIKILTSHNFFQVNGKINKEKKNRKPTYINKVATTYLDFGIIL